MNVFKSKKLKYGSLSVLFTIIFIVAIVLVNIVINLVLTRFDVKVDLTDSKMFSIEKSTAEYLSGIDDDITITVAYDEEGFIGAGDYYRQTSEILKRFSEANSRISVRYLPLDLNPTVYAEYGANHYDGEIIVKSEKTGRYVILSADDYVNAKYSFNGEQISTEDAYYYMQLGFSSYLEVDTSAGAEEGIASAIMNVTDTNPVRVAFMTGFGAAQSQTLTELLQKNVYVLETIDASTVSEIDPEIDYIVINAPTTDYSNEALSALDKWLDNGGIYGKNVVYIPSVEAVDTPNIDSFLAEWGIELEKATLLQTDGEYAYTAGGSYQTLELQETDYSDGVNVSSAYTYGDMLRPIKLLFDENGHYETKAILTTYDGAVKKPFGVGEAWKVSDADEIGSYNVLVESNKVVFPNNVPSYSRVFVYGGSTLIHDTYMTTAQANNDAIFMNLFNKTCDKTELGLSFSVKSFDIKVTEINSNTKNFIGLLFAVIIPVIIIATGIFVWIRRKRK